MNRHNDFFCYAQKIFCYSEFFCYATMTSTFTKFLWNLQNLLKRNKETSYILLSILKKFNEKRVGTLTRIAEVPESENIDIGMLDTL